MFYKVIVKICFVLVKETSVCRSDAKNKLLHKAEMVKVEGCCIYSINIENYCLLFTFLPFHYVN